MNYSRAAFRAWLVTLPDVPKLWTKDWGGTVVPTCPIGEFLSLNCLAARDIDRELASLIDRNAETRIRLKSTWEKEAPSKIIALIDSLEEKTKETPKQQTTEWCNTPFQPSVREVA